MAVLMTGSQLMAFDWGFKFGLSHIGYSFSDSSFPVEHEFRSEFIGGAFLGIRLSENFSLQPELYVARRGMNFFPDNGWKYLHRIYYWEMPLLLKYRIPFKGRSVPEIFIGPYYGVKIASETVNIYDDFHEYMIDHQDNLEDAVQKWDYGLVLGGSVEVDTCLTTLLVDIRYCLGLANILKDPVAYSHHVRLNDAFLENSSLKNRALRIMFGISF